jgi:UDP-2,3-diacylglucosamine hydrolase
MKAVFIADAHLKGLDDPNQRLLCTFLEELNDIDILFIVGDLFEFWTGYNEVLYHHYSPVIEELIKLKNRGTRIIYVEGNHDFSIGPFFTTRVGADVYPDSAIISMDGNKLYLTHGDIIDRRSGYVFWRWFLRSPLFRLINSIVPSSYGWKVAMVLSNRSRHYMERGIILDRLLKEHARKKIKEGFDIIVMAHSHLASVSKEAVDGRDGLYANPGDWAGDHNYLIYEDGRFRVEKLSE